MRTLVQGSVAYPQRVRPVAGWSNGPVTVVLTQNDLRLLVAALDQSEGTDAQELRDGLAEMIGDPEPDA